MQTKQTKKKDEAEGQLETAKAALELDLAEKQKNYTREVLLAGAGLALAALSFALKFSEKIDLQITIIIVCVAALCVLVAAALGVSKYVSAPDLESTPLADAKIEELVKKQDLSGSNQVK